MKQASARNQAQDLLHSQAGRPRVRICRCMVAGRELPFSLSAVPVAKPEGLRSACFVTLSVCITSRNAAAHHTSSINPLLVQMGWYNPLGPLLGLGSWTLLVLLVTASESGPQEPLVSPSAVNRPSAWLSRLWDERLDGDATGNLIFQSLAGLLQMKANSKHPHGT